MADDLVQRAHWGDLKGQNWAGLARLSFEPEEEEVTASADGADPGEASTNPQRHKPMTGKDIKSREEQERDNRAFVESRGGTYVHTYEEPDTSAWKRKRVRLADGTVAYRVVRPVFEAALNDLKRGMTQDGKPIDGLIVYDIDRLTRDNRHLEDAIEVVENFRRPIIDITGTLDLLTDNGRTVARLLVAVANKASSDTARRVKRKHKAMQAAGIPAGGPRPFGWAEDRRTLDPVEAAAIRKATKRILTGAPIRSIVTEWNKQGITTTRGKLWSRSSLKFVLRNPRVCGYRGRAVSEVSADGGTANQRMEIVYDEQGNPVTGQWEAIVSLADWQALIELIGDNPAPGDGHNARKYLCVGTLRCDKEGCGALLRASKAPASRNKPEGFFYYNCPGGERGCGGPKIPGPETDVAITKLVIAKYEEEAARRDARTAPQKWDKEEELSRLREDITDWREERAARRITKERFFAFLAEAEAAERHLLTERNAWQRQMHAAQGQPVNLRQDWPDLDFAEKRAYVERALLAVLVAPAVKWGAPVWNRLTPLYRPNE